MQTTQDPKLHTQARRIRKDELAARNYRLAASFPLFLLLIMVVGFFLRTQPLLEHSSVWEILSGMQWRPSAGEFGLLTFISGTLSVTLLALLLAAPLCMLTSLFLVEYAKRRALTAILPAIDLLAGIPSVVYGVWGLLVIVPLVPQISGFVQPWLGSIPLFAANNPTGYSILSGGIVLAVMISPIIISVSIEVLRSVPDGLRHGSLALGATRWQTIKKVVLPRAMPGLIAAIVMGLSRAFGETLAVMMVVGNTPLIPRSIFDPGYPLTALIANNYGEMMSIPLYDSALMGAALLLLVIVIIFNLGAALVLIRANRRAQV
ncbi:MAG: phosphate ABC transporter permease subunit PstC [Anaerolineales bacterium]|nr:MAG: phosphate ABC transporter permease subunit PstC [Anaerolineales bacterium]